jgi:hypothetical protein
MRDIIFGKSRVVEGVEEGGGVFNTGGKEIGGVGGNKGYIYSR